VALVVQGQLGALLAPVWSSAVSAEWSREAGTVGVNVERPGRHRPQVIPTGSKKAARSLERPHRERAGMRPALPDRHGCRR
jgi:hypothetical protein